MEQLAGQLVGFDVDDNVDGDGDDVALWHQLARSSSKGIQQNPLREYRDIENIGFGNKDNNSQNNISLNLSLASFVASFPFGAFQLFALGTNIQPTIHLDPVEGHGTESGRSVGKQGWDVVGTVEGDNTERKQGVERDNNLNGGRLKSSGGHVASVVVHTARKSQNVVDEALERGGGKGKEESKGEWDKSMALQAPPHCYHHRCCHRHCHFRNRMTRIHLYQQCNHRSQDKDTVVDNRQTSGQDLLYLRSLCRLSQFHRHYYCLQLLCHTEQMVLQPRQKFLPKNLMNQTRPAPCDEPLPFQRTTNSLA